MKDETVFNSAKTANYEALAIKGRHLATENANLRATLQDCSEQMRLLDLINDELKKNSHKSVQILIQQLSKQNVNLQKALFRQIKYN